MLSKASFRQSLNFYRNGVQLINGYAKKSQGENQVDATSVKPKGLPRGYIGPSAFNLYYQDFLKKDKQTAEMRITERMKAASKEWKTLAEQAKEDFVKQSQQLTEQKKNEYNKLSSDEQAKLHDESVKRREERKAVKDRKARRKYYEETGRPKAPLSAYLRYAKDFIQRKPVSSIVEAQSRVREVAQTWKELPEAEKKKYTEAATEDSRVFHEKLEAWETKEKSNKGALKYKSPSKVRAIKNKEMKIKQKSRKLVKDITKTEKQMKKAQTQLKKLTSNLTKLAIGPELKKKAAKKISEGKTDEETAKKTSAKDAPK
ncbi:HMG-box domain-containing protein [Ditylenchus destructor]|nr:HMG-box domain-containing protein [Ditylenchus destructor]